MFKQHGLRFNMFNLMWTLAKNTYITSKSGCLDRINPGTVISYPICDLKKVFASYLVYREPWFSWLTNLGTWELTSLNSNLLHFKHVTRWSLQIILYSSLASFKESAEFNRNFSGIYEVIIVNVNCYICWDTVVILKPVEKHKTTHSYQKWPRLSYFWVSVFVIFSILTRLIKPFSKLFNQYLVNRFYVQRWNTKMKKWDTFIILRNLELFLILLPYHQSPCDFICFGTNFTSSWPA